MALYLNGVKQDGSTVSSNSAGTDLTGADGASNRTLTGQGSNIRQVSIDREILRPTTDYTVSAGTITFLVIVWDVALITVWRQRS